MDELLYTLRYVIDVSNKITDYLQKGNFKHAEEYLNVLLKNSARIQELFQEHRYGLKCNDKKSNVLLGITTNRHRLEVRVTPSGLIQIYGPEKPTPPMDKQKTVLVPVDKLRALNKVYHGRWCCPACGEEAWCKWSKEYGECTNKDCWLAELLRGMG